MDKNTVGLWDEYPVSLCPMVFTAVELSRLPRDRVRGMPLAESSRLHDYVAAEKYTKMRRTGLHDVLRASATSTVRACTRSQRLLRTTRTVTAHAAVGGLSRRGVTSCRWPAFHSKWHRAAWRCKRGFRP